MRWVAKYADGHTVKEKDVSYVNLDRNGLVQFSLYDGSKRKATVTLTEGQTLFYRMRTFNATKPTENKIWLVGWRTKNDLHLILLREDGKTEEYTAWNTTPLTYEPEWFPFE